MDYREFFRMSSEQNKLVIDTINLQETEGIPRRFTHIMQHDFIDRIAGVKEGSYIKNPEQVYNMCMNNFGCEIIDQYIPTNPLMIGNKGFESDTIRTATTGAEKIVLNGILINSPEAVLEHLEKHHFPSMMKQIEEFNEEEYIRETLETEAEIQKKTGPAMLKTGFGILQMPLLLYGLYGYENYFMAYVLYPEVIEKQFSLEADLAVIKNRAIVKACKEYNLPFLQRIAHDMADSRGTMVNIKTLDEIWFPHFHRSMEEAVKAGLKIMWHCCGNLMQMIPRLIECGIKGFQGFQYSHGMDYEKICSMKNIAGENLLIWGGVESTTTLLKGKPEDIKKELKWLVEKGPKTGLFIGASHAVLPGTPWENIITLKEGLQYYR